MPSAIAVETVLKVRYDTRCTCDEVNYFRAKSLARAYRGVRLIASKPRVIRVSRGLDGAIIIPSTRQPEMRELSQIPMLLHRRFLQLIDRYPVRECVRRLVFFLFIDIESGISTM